MNTFYIAAILWIAYEFYQVIKWSPSETQIKTIQSNPERKMIEGAVFIKDVKEGGYTEYFIECDHIDPSVNMKIMNDGVSYDIVFYNRHTNDIMHNIIFEAEVPLYFIVKKYVGKKIKILFAISGVCHWEFEYVYKHTKLPPQCSIFYEVFKSEFLKGNFMNIAGEKNYSFYLMYDLIESSICDKETHLLNLMIHYPSVTTVCE